MRSSSHAGYYVYNTLCIILCGIAASVYEVPCEKYHDLGKSDPSFPTHNPTYKWILLNSNLNYLFFTLQEKKKSLILQ